MLSRVLARALQRRRMPAGTFLLPIFLTLYKPSTTETACPEKTEKEAENIRNSKRPKQMDRLKHTRKEAKT